MKSPEKPDGLTKREFLRKVVVGGAVMFVAAGGYVRPELQTLQGPQVAHATGSHKPNQPPYSHDYDKKLDALKNWLEELLKKAKKKNN